MSLSPHQRGTINSISKQKVEAMNESMQHSGEMFYNVGAPGLEQTQNTPGCVVDSSPEVQGSNVFKSDKGYQVRGHFQQAGSVKWVHQDPVQTSAWFQGLPNMTKWTPNFGPSLSGMDDPRSFHKAGHEMEALKLEKLSPASSQSYPETSQVPGQEWDHHSMAAMHHAQFQALQQGHRPAELQYPLQGMHHDMPDPTLQPFQLAFGNTKQPQAPDFHQVYQGNNASLNMNYVEKPKTQQQVLQLQQQQHQLHHQHQMQQMHMRQFQQQQHQIQQQRRLQHIQQQYQQQQKMQEQMQQQMQLQQHTQGLHQAESIPSQETQQGKQQTESAQGNIESSPLSHQTPLTVSQTPAPQHQIPQASNFPDSGPVKTIPEPQEAQSKRQVLPRRSRRLSKDSVSPEENQTSRDSVSAPNGGVAGVRDPAVGVIKSIQRRRRASKEINLETLAQKASEMEFLPARSEENAPARPAGMVPLVMPVSVPVSKGQAQMEGPDTFAHPDDVRHPSETPEPQNQPERKPSVIVARRHSLKNSGLENFIQGKGEEDKSRRRPRPEPLVIPPPKPFTFIAPSVYSSITPYQSNLRSPVRLPEHASIIPPYTPPPILSPVREGSGLYFSAVLSSMAAGSQILPPPQTPRSAARSLLRSISSDITPPAPQLIGEATPVSLEPRINIGSRYQAEIPELQDQTISQNDQHKATLVWLPLSETDSTPSLDARVDDLMNLVCSSVLSGGGTNTELAMHCLHECRGDVMATLEMMLMENPVFSVNHHLGNYRYAGSDYWTVDEKQYFNKGISAYRKDFFLVQKLVRSKTVAQCVEFYYTYKKQVKVARNGSLIYGPLDPEERVPLIKQEQQEEGIHNRQQVAKQDNANDSSKDVSKTHENQRTDSPHEEQKNSCVEDNSGLKPAVQPAFKTPSPAPQKPDSAGKKSRASTVNKSQGEPEGIFPCKKCTRVFSKVKSRSAHMKSHSEQEKKAAALRQREEEERAAATLRQKALEAQAEGVQGESSGAEESSIEPEDEQDEDWH
ncbi:mitotic deacetylase associated SANT domain protein a isoform X1 [Triplophysa dalaica]|uniref:mitotic deacetylase associated SANT domain protein a isoform X1 n=1 Tax=Triplophysa dalaica TaxID=1582913 RepID=UPI0024DF78B0|nr:mitotic deacetylase associated SANT domain protein a isoform X1 [Triplophysa dalaica]